MIKRAIAGVVPAEEEERTVMVVWPSIAAYAVGRWLGRLYDNQVGYYVLTVGNVIALLTIPVALVLYFFRLLPSVFGSTMHGSRYELTNRRVVELQSKIAFRRQFPFLKFVFSAESKSVELDRFDSIEIDRREGQEWFDAGDLVFKLSGVETFRLAGVSRPAAFRQTCLKSRVSHVGVKLALSRETARV